MIRVVVGIIKKNDKALIAERPLGKPYAGYWEFPGGKVEEQESSIDALKREFHEEIGIEIQQANFLFEHSHVYPDKTVNLEMWLVTHFCGEPCGKENQIIRWVTMSEMDDLQILSGNIPILKRIKALF